MEYLFWKQFFTIMKTPNSKVIFKGYKMFILKVIFYYYKTQHLFQKLFFLLLWSVYSKMV